MNQFLTIFIQIIQQGFIFSNIIFSNIIINCPIIFRQYKSIRLICQYNIKTIKLVMKAELVRKQSCCLSDSDEQQFEFQNNYDQSNSSQEIKKPRIYKKQNPSVTGKWTEQEHIRYIMFMDYFQELFISHQRRKLSKIFSIMAKYIPTRESDQCRSHHQKMLSKHKTCKKIVTHFKRKCQHYETEFLKFALEIKNSFENQISTHEEPIKQMIEAQIQTDPVLVFSNPQEMWMHFQAKISSFYASQLNAYHHQPINYFYN